MYRDLRESVKNNLNDKPLIPGIKSLVDGPGTSIITDRVAWELPHTNVYGGVDRFTIVGTQPHHDFARATYETSRLSSGYSLLCMAVSQRLDTLKLSSYDAHLYS